MSVAGTPPKDTVESGPRSVPEIVKAWSPVEGPLEGAIDVGAGVSS